MKNLLLAWMIFLLPVFSSAQGTSVKRTPKNWYQLDKTDNGYYGISLDKAYSLLKNKSSKTVIVAVIDNGIDTTQEDLKSVLWHNPKEIAGNNADDDHNGYTDDIYGWNFLGGKDGNNVQVDSDEGARVYYKLKEKYGNKVPDPSSAKTTEERYEIEMYRKAKARFDNSDASSVDLFFMKRVSYSMHISDSILQIALNKKIFTGEELEDFVPTKPDVVRAKSIFYGMLKADESLDETNKQFITELDEYIAGEERKAESKGTPPKNYRGDIVKDDESNFNDRDYGNKDVMAGYPMHGTHCAGIIAAARNNNIGIDGIADNVKIMMLRAVPDGDEHDKDIALAIKYAVDNGAQVISMSFGKDFSPQKKWVDEAVRYAESNGVLLVHASGNDKKNIDTVKYYPNPYYLDGKGKATNFITVGASGDPSNGGITADFSNYGKKEVDVFAPGVKIYSTFPGGNEYGSLSGTSMACPVVAGIAALILEYYPDLSAQQLKYVIEKSAVAVTEKVKKPGSDEEVSLSDISKTGGIVNAYEAVKLAATIKGERNLKQPVIIKPKVVNKKKD